MPSPAADLANFMFVVRELRNAEGADKVKVVQVGDLYELWMNREFMYRESPVIGADQLGDRGTLTGISVRAALLNTDMSFPTAFQYRHDRDWVHGGTAHAAKRYVYHGWERDLLLRRHDVAASNPGAARMGGLLSDRIAAVEEWSYAEPATDPLLPGLRQWVNGRRATFTRANARGITETRWNKIVLELLGVELSAIRIHGNHDGYRSDAALLPNRGSPAASTQWFSEAGVWVEHGHRWDYFNRDGVSMGAGMTNVVYYHNEDLIAASGGRMAAVLQQEQGFFQTGAAQWYLLVNYGNRSWWGSGVETFGVFVSGHTHGPDLVKIYFQLATADRAADWGRQRQEDLDRMQRRVRQAASDAADRAAQTARDAAAGARRRLDQLHRRASELWREWSPF